MIQNSRMLKRPATHRGCVNMNAINRFPPSFLWTRLSTWSSSSSIVHHESAERTGDGVSLNNVNQIKSYSCFHCFTKAFGEEDSFRFMFETLWHPANSLAFWLLFKIGYLFVHCKILLFAVEANSLLYVSTIFMNFLLWAIVKAVQYLWTDLLGTIYECCKYNFPALFATVISWAGIPSVYRCRFVWTHVFFRVMLYTCYVITGHVNCAS